MGGVFDITMDCEDGAPTGAEKAHAEMVVRMAKQPRQRAQHVGQCASLTTLTNTGRPDIDNRGGRSG
jgi:citrate lyase subunit beta/citryl-CoA lyase